MYVAESGGLLQAIDFANPQNPQTVGGVALPGDAGSVALTGDYAYVTAGASLQIVDLTSRPAFQIVGSVALPGAAGKSRGLGRLCLCPLGQLRGHG